MAQPKIIVVGGGFGGGLAAGKALQNAPAQIMQIILINRANHDLSQP